MGLGAAPLVGPLVVHAQQPAKLRRIGVLSPFPAGRDTNHEFFRQRLRELGHIDGKTVVFDYLTAEGQNTRLAALAIELVQRNPDVILTNSTPAALAAKSATSTIPIVFVGVADPVGQGIVASLARPGGNLTGMSIQTAQTSVKTLELLKEILPTATRVAVLANPTNASHPAILRELESAARHLRLETSIVHAGSPQELEKAFTEAKRLAADGLVIVSDALYTTNNSRLAQLGVAHRLPAIGGSPFYPERGGLIAYGANREAYYRRSADLVDRILKGAKPADLPVEQPTRFDLIVNLKTAKALGITIPQTVLVWADKVIQ